MDTAQFLGRVLPEEGYYALVTIENGAVDQRFFDSTTKLAKATTILDTNGYNVYYSVSSFAERGSRKQDAVLATKLLAIDIDCGENKPVSTQADGIRALRAFIRTNKLPAPSLIVSSGNGLHVYWVLDRALARDEWLPLATAMRAAIPRCPTTSKFLFDTAVTADSARVLRAPGTTNRKGGEPKSVQVLHEGADVPVEALVAALGQPTTHVVQQPNKSRLLDNLAVKYEYQPANPDAILDKCAQIAWAVDNPEDVSEPFWYAMMGVASVCADPEGVALAWSQGHPEFDETKTLRKLGQWRRSATGPAMCSRFEAERPDGCKKCPFKGKIKTPAGFGTTYQEAQVSADAPDESATAVPMPSPYKRAKGKDGGVAGIVYNIDGTEIQLCKFDLYPLGYGKDDSLGYETVRYRWKRPHVGWQTLAFRQAYLTQQAIRDFASVIADQGIVLETKGQTEAFQHMLRSYMEELRQLKSVTNLYSTMGWKENNTQFLIGETLVRKDVDGSVIHDTATMSTTIQRSTDSMYGVAGTAEEWAHFTSLLQKANMPIHMFMLLVSASAPLYQFSGLNGLTINVNGPTGAGKTLGQLWQQSIWGNPIKLHYTAKFTQNALFSRMGFYNNLPVTIDETTMLPPKEVGDFLYWVTQGRDKARLARSAEERDHKTWATVVTTSSNRSMSSMLIASGMESDAQMARLLEVQIDAHSLFTKNTSAGKKIFDFLATHYGQVGRVILTHLVEMGEARLRADITDHRTRFYSKYNCKFAGNERYWEQGISLADYMGEIMVKLGLIQFDPRVAIEAILLQIGAMRRVITENTTDAFDAVADYLNEYADAALQVIHNGTPKPFVDERRLPRGEVRIRFDLYGTSGSTSGPFDNGTVMIDRKHFKWWLACKGVDIRNIVRDIQGQGADATPATEKIFMGKNTPIKLGQQRVLGLDLKHPRLSGMLREIVANTEPSMETVQNVVPMKRP